MSVRSEPAVPRVLIADDQPDVLEALRLLLKAEGFSIESAGSPAAILEAVDGDDYDVVLMDLNYTRDTTSGQEGLDLLSQLRRHDPTLPVVVMTAWGSVEVAVEAMRRGARDFVQKPWENARLLTIVRTQVELARALRRQQRLEAENRSLKPDVRPLLIADAPSMRPVLELISRVGPSEANILVTGENGTGKGTVAQAVHAVSGRAGRGLVTVNAGGLSEGVFESELFGHVKGAFTDAKTDRVGRFELADGGTLFLDEIANVPLNLQPKLLRVLETGDFERVGSSRTRKVNVRIVSATNANLAEDCCRRCGTGVKTFPRSRCISCGSTGSGTASTSTASKRRRCRRSSIIPGPGTSASSITRSNAACSWPRARASGSASSGCASTASRPRASKT